MVAIARKIFLALLAPNLAILFLTSAAQVASGQAGRIVDEIDDVGTQRPDFRNAVVCFNQDSDVATKIFVELKKRDRTLRRVTDGGQNRCLLTAIENRRYIVHIWWDAPMAQQVASSASYYSSSGSGTSSARSSRNSGGSFGQSASLSGEEIVVPAHVSLIRPDGTTVELGYAYSPVFAGNETGTYQSSSYSNSSSSNRNGSSFHFGFGSGGGSSSRTISPEAAEMRAALRAAMKLATPAKWFELWRGENWLWSHTYARWYPGAAKEVEEAFGR